MDINPSYTTIGKIFEQNYIFSIPKYQRYYAWEDEQVDDYIRDISALIGHSDYDHFLEELSVLKKVYPDLEDLSERLLMGNSG